MKKQISKIIALSLGVTIIVPNYSFGADLGFSELPSNANAGQCYARKLIPAVYKDVPVNYVSHEQMEQIEVRDPQFAARNQTIVTKDGYTKYIVTEPEFKTINENIVTRPAFDRLIVNPAQTSNEAITVLIKEPRMVWRRGDNLSSVKRLDNNTGEIYCLVEERGQTQVLTRTVVTRPATISSVRVPAIVKSISKEVLVKPSTISKIEVPQETKTIQVQDLVQPAAERRRLIPQQVSTYNKQELITPEHYEWVQVECEKTAPNAPPPQMPTYNPNTSSYGVVNPPTYNNVPKQYDAPPVFNPPMGNTNNAVINNQVPNQRTVSARALQTELAKKGLYKGPIDGIYGPLTIDAVSKLQKSLGKVPNGRVTVDVVDALGL